MITKLLPLTRLKLEILFEIYASKQAYLRELARTLKKSPSLCAKSMGALYKSGLVKKSKAGKTIYYSLLPSYKTDVIIRFLDEYYLEKAGDKSGKLKALINLARSNFELTGACDAIYIFGSFARGSFTEKSDIDMLFLTEEKDIAARFIREASIAINTEINGITLDKKEFSDALKKKEPFTASIIENPKERLVVWKK